MTTLLTSLTGSAVLTSGTAPTIGKINVYNATSGAITATLPALSALNVGARLIVAKYAGDTSANTVTINCAGGDTFQHAAQTSVVLSVTGERRELQVISVSGTKYWADASTLTPLSALDGRYATPIDAFLANEFTAGEATLPRMIASGTPATGNGNLRMTFFTARKTETISKVRLQAQTAQVGATLLRIGIFQADAFDNLTLVASTANDTNLLVSAGVIYEKALQAPWSKVRGIRYAAGLLPVGTSTSPVLYGIVNNGCDNTLAPKIGAMVQSQTDLPSTISSGSLIVQNHWPMIVMIP